MNPKNSVQEFPVTAEFRVTAMALLSGFREARSVLDVYIHVFEYFEEQLAPDVADCPSKPPPKVEPMLVRKAQQVKKMMSMFGKLVVTGNCR
jgi:hypothetical protein